MSGDRGREAGTTSALESTRKPTAQRVVVVTGGSGGIGRAVCDMFSANGDAVFEISRSGGDRQGVTHISADLSDSEAAEAAVAEVAARAGKIDI